MNRDFLVALRNDKNQLLVLEDAASRPVFPGGEIHGGAILRVVSQTVEQTTGLRIGGLHLGSVGAAPGPKREVHRFTAYVVGGDLLDFSSHHAHFLSASWIAPTLIPKIAGASEDMLALVKDLSWMLIRDSRVST